jgi:hypothetical protein
MDWLSTAVPFKKIESTRQAGAKGQSALQRHGF